MRKRKRKAKWVPWYRARNYKGALTEAEKRQLDAFRARPTHPATEGLDLPEAVQSYITRIEGELYDAKQDKLAGLALGVSIIGAVLLVLNFTAGVVFVPTVWSYLGAAVMFVAPLIVYGYLWKKNADEFNPTDEDVPNLSYEGIIKEWELEYIWRIRKQQRERTSDRNDTTQ